MTVQDVLKERGSRYGAFEGHARITQRLKNVLRDESGWALLTHEQQEALDMIFHKIARMVNGDPTYLDNAVDLVGYAELMRASMEKKAAG